MDTQTPYAEKKSKCTLAQFKKEWKGRDGTMYDFNIEFDNGDKGVYQYNQKEQPTFKAGVEAEYSIVSRQRNGYTDVVIKPVIKNNSPNARKGYYEKDFRKEHISYAARFATDLVVSGKAELKAFRKVFQTMYDAMDEQLTKLNGQNSSETKSDDKENK